MIMSKTISVSQIKEAAQEAYEQFKDNTGGKNADYIPYLANIDKNLFGISIWQNHYVRGLFLLFRDRIRFESTYGYPGTSPVRSRESAKDDRCRCHRSSFQLHHGDLVGK